MPAEEEAALYRANAPDRFWRLLDAQPTAAEWAAAVAVAAAELPAGARRSGDGIEAVLSSTLGEGQFGPGHWRLGLAKRAYYQLKPLLPRTLIKGMRQAHRGRAETGFPLSWPIEDRYAGFLAGVVRELLRQAGRESFEFIDFWPEGRPFALVLTHDIETAEGQAHALEVAALEAGHGFRSSFNVVPERYPVDRGVIRELRERGFEVGLHDLKHDGKLFNSRRGFARRARRINRHLDELGAAGFRAALTHRNPLWMQQLDVEYDLSFFDTDPYEPIPGGTMSLWPFQVGRFLELPYTLVQDNTLTSILGEEGPRVWFEKVDFVSRHRGLALVNSHPDYLKEPANRRVYERFLEAMAARQGTREAAWHCLPVEAARWWRSRAEAASIDDLPGGTLAEVGRGGWPSVRCIGEGAAPLQ
jgi:hypothetical protein